MSTENSKQTVIINATNIGRRLSGIGIYIISLLKTLSTIQTDLHFIVYVNESCKPYIQEIPFRDNFSLRWVSHRLSPDNGFKGHLRRLLFANYLSLKYRSTLIFNTSQSEACFCRSNQVITIHDVIPYLFKQYHQKQYYYFRYFLKFALRSAKCVITPSTNSRDLLETLYQLSRNRIRVIPHGIQEIYRKSARSRNRKREDFILYTGRISPMKNIAGIFKAFSRIKDKIPHKLVIVGEEKPEIEKEIRAGRLSRQDVENERVLFKGHIQDFEMRDLLNRASLLIFPSLYEGFGLPPLEAMACGCPVVASNAASLPEVCGNAAYYVDPYSIESIAEGMYCVLTNRKLKKYLTGKGFARAKLYHWETSAGEHLKIFREILEIKPAPAPFLPTPALVPLQEKAENYVR